jgi:ABC-type antimicrobial peptide transport system ATPase subunit
MGNVKFTPENLLSNLDKLGAWSLYGLATDALKHYFPDEYDEYGYCETRREIELVYKLGCKSWNDVVIKYHNEISYDSDYLSNDLFVNEH